MNIKKLKKDKLTKHWIQDLNQEFENEVKNKKIKKNKNNRDYYTH